MRQMVAYKRLKTMENLYPSGRKKWSRSLTGGGRLLEVFNNSKALAGKILVFWIGGRLWETIAYERRSHMEVLLYFDMEPIIYIDTTLLHIQFVYKINRQ